MLVKVTVCDSALTLETAARRAAAERMKENIAVEERMLAEGNRLAIVFLELKQDLFIHVRQRLATFIRQATLRCCCSYAMCSKK